MKRLLFLIFFLTLIFFYNLSLSAQKVYAQQCAPGPDPICTSSGGSACVKKCSDGSVCATSHQYCVYHSSGNTCECPTTYDVDNCATQCTSSSSTPTPTPGCFRNNVFCRVPSECCSNYCDDINTFTCQPAPTSMPLPPPPPTTYDNWSTCQTKIVVSGAQVDVPTIKCFFVVLGNLITALFEFAGAVAIIFIVIGGIKFLTSRGDREKIESAKKTVTYAIIGLLVIAFSYLIIGLLETILGVEIVKLPIF